MQEEEYARICKRKNMFSKQHIHVDAEFVGVS